jgi:hypothetical protein
MTRYKLYKIIKKIPIIKRKALKIACWFYPISQIEWKRVVDFINEDEE